MRFEQKTDNFFFTHHCGCGRRLGKGIYIFLLLPLISEKSAGIEPPLCEIFPSSVDTSVRQNDFWPKEFEYFLFDTAKKAKYIRLDCRGNSSTASAKWNSITEVKAFR